MIHKPTLSEILAVNGGLLPRLAGGAFQTWETLVNSGQINLTSTGNVKTKKVLACLSPPGEAAGEKEALVIPANYIVAGNIIRFTAKGFYSTKAAVKPTLSLGLYINKLEAAKALAVTGLLETEGGKVETAWDLEATTRVVTGGEKGKAITAGVVRGIVLDLSSVKVGAQTSFMPATKNGAELEVNWTVANAVMLGATWSEESAENTITCNQWLVEILN